MTKAKPQDIGIYVASFDGYSDVWQPFFACFWKYWPDCPYKVYLGANQKTFEDKRVTTLHAEAHDNWSSRALEHLSKVPHEYVLLMLEDYFLNHPVDTEKLSTIASYMETFGLHALRLYAEPKPAIAISAYPLIGFQAIGQQNRTNTHATLWRKSSLMEIIRAGESLWQFEVHGSIRSNRFAGGVCGVWNTVLPYEMGIERGKWFRHTYRHLTAQGIAIDTNARGIHSVPYHLKMLYYRYVGFTFRRFTPLRLRQGLKFLISPESYGHLRVK